MGDQPGDREESRMTCKAYDIPKTLIWEAWLHVKANQGAAGIDAETIERFENRLGDNLCKLWNRMSAGGYFPPPVKASERLGSQFRREVSKNHAVAMISWTASHQPEFPR